MPGPGLSDKTLRNLVEVVSAALAQAIQFPDQAGQILEALRARRANLRRLDDRQLGRLAQAAVAPSVSAELRRYVARESEAMTVFSFFCAIVKDATSDAESLQFLRQLEVAGFKEFQIRQMLQSQSVPAREFGARVAIQQDHFLLVAAVTLLHDGNVEWLRAQAARSPPGSPLRKARALAEILLARPSTSADAAEALEAVGSPSSWFIGELVLEPALGPFCMSPCADLAPILHPIHRLKRILLTLIDAVRPDLAVPILLGYKPALLLGDDLHRLRSAPGFVSGLVRARPDIPRIAVELCSVFQSGPRQLRSWLPLSEEEAAEALPGFLFSVFAGLSKAAEYVWMANLRGSCSDAHLAAIQTSFVASAAGSVATTVARGRDAADAYRAWFERAACAEEWDGLVAAVALQYGPIRVDAVWPFVTTAMAALIAQAAWKFDPETVLPPRPDMPEILERIERSPASGSVRAHALAARIRCRQASGDR